MNMDKNKHLLVIQIPIEESTEIDLSRNRLLAIPANGRGFHDAVRASIEYAFTDNEHAQLESFSYGDRRDGGNGRHNIFLLVKGDWEAALVRAKAYLSRHGVVDDFVIARKPADSERFEAVWPPQHATPFSL